MKKKLILLLVSILVLTNIPIRAFAKGKNEDYPGKTPYTDTSTPKSSKSKASTTGPKGSPKSKSKAPKSTPPEIILYKKNNSGVTYVKTTSTKKKVVIKDTIKTKNRTYKVTAVGNNALKNNKTITEVTIGKNVKTIGISAFENNPKLKKVIIESQNLKKINNKAFANDKNLKKVVIKSKKVTIGKNAFKKCKKASIIANDKVKKQANKTK